MSKQKVTIEQIDNSGKCPCPLCSSQDVVSESVAEVAVFETQESEEE